MVGQKPAVAANDDHTLIADTNDGHSGPSSLGVQLLEETAARDSGASSTTLLSVSDPPPNGHPTNTGGTLLPEISTSAALMAPSSQSSLPDSGHLSPTSLPLSLQRSPPPFSESESTPLYELLVPHLQCPICDLRLVAPTTLHCGHSLCTQHLNRQSLTCPVLNCAPAEAISPAIPSSSTVAYFPAPPQEHAPHATAQDSPSRVDVTISKVMELVDYVRDELDRKDQPKALTFKDDSDASDDDDDEPQHPEASSSSVTRSRPRATSTSSVERPRKRRRRHPPPEDDDDGDLLTHLVTQSARQRSTRYDQPLLPPHPPSANPSTESIHSRFEKDILSELTCEICYTLLYQPITTPCQHTYCAKCLHRSLDHSPSCPLCRQDLPGFLYFQDHPHNKVILSLILEAFPAIYQERKEAIEAEERDARLNTPIFVCQLSFPGMPTLLHFFEPRYRLMLRRCLESPHPCFGMVMPAKPGSGPPQTEYGTMLDIRSVQMQTDGRSLVETWGAYRFRILESGTLDGYMVGRIERIDDYEEDLTENTLPIPEPAPSTSTSSDQRSNSSASTSRTFGPPPPSSPSVVLPRHPSNAALMTQCRAFLDQLQRGTAPWLVQRLSSTYGAMPSDVSSFSYWVASILPIDEHEKAKLLPIRSPRLRLLLVVHWIEQLNNNWYTAFSLLRLAKHAFLLIGLLFFCVWGSASALGIV